MEGGVIDGQVPQFVTSLDGAADQFKFTQYYTPATGEYRLRLIDFKHSINVFVQDVTLVDSTSFHLHFFELQQRACGKSHCGFGFAVAEL